MPVGPSLSPASLASVYTVLLNAREADKTELFATEFDPDPFALAQRIIALPGFSWAAWMGLRPVACFGAATIHPGVCSVWAAGTEEFQRVGRLVTKHVRKVMIPQLIDAGMHRAECRVMASNREARRWVEHLGATQEAVLVGFGSRQEDFILYAWYNEPRQDARHSAAPEAA